MERRGVGVFGTALAVVNAYQLLLLAAAALPGRNRPPESSRLRFVVLVPAHDEEARLGRVLDELAAQDYPKELVEVVVVADNCSDGTADVARAAGVEVLERDEPALRGKGWALAWAIDRLERAYDAVLVIDADCEPSPNLIAASASRLAAGADATQSDNLVTNADASAVAALRAGALALSGRIRARGKDRLGLSCGLFGTGMAFRRDVLESHSWRGDALAEDLEYHLSLVDSGRRVRFVAEASVGSAMPLNGVAGGAQERRWEAGKVHAARRWLPRLITHGGAARLHAALDLAVPPQSLLATLNLAGLAIARSPRQRRLAAANVAAHALFVLGGLRVADAPREVYASLLHSPALAVRKIALYARLAKDKPGTWEKGAR